MADAGGRVRRAGVEHASLAVVAGGRFLMGCEGPEAWPGDREGPVRELEVAPFLIDRFAVSNARFAAFAVETGYVTEAERIGWSFVFHLFLPADHPPTRAVVGAPWWRQVEGADWAHPEGPGSHVHHRMDHPVVHVSWNDAAAYAEWAGGRLPSEVEWELAARGGLVQRRFPWGDELLVDGEHRCNVWQGRFPLEDSGEDGYRGTAPVGAFPPNGLGLHNMVGNVWEWCADRFAPGTSARTIRGGSYLCHDSYCNRYRVSARTQNEPSSSTGHMGFRLAADPD